MDAETRGVEGIMEGFVKEAGLMLTMEHDQNMGSQRRRDVPNKGKDEQLKD